MKRILFALLLAWVSGVAVAADTLQATLERHLRDDVGWWLDEPRLQALLRDNSARNAALDADAIADLERRWQAELDLDDGELTGHVMTRFASKYLAEVVLRMDGAYRNAVVLDARGLVAAAAELPGRMYLGDEPVVAALAGPTPPPWAQGSRPVAGNGTPVALPLVDPDSGARIGTLLVEVDAARLAKAGSMRAGSQRRAADTVSARDDLADVAASN